MAAQHRRMITAQWQECIQQWFMRAFIIYTIMYEKFMIIVLRLSHGTKKLTFFVGTGSCMHFQSNLVIRE